MITIMEREELREIQNKLVAQCEQLKMKPCDEVFYHITLKELKCYVYPDYLEEIKAACEHYNCARRIT